MSFRLVPNSVTNSMTLNDSERRNNLNRCVISPNSLAFGTDYVKNGLRHTPTFCSRNVGQ